MVLLDPKTRKELHRYVRWMANELGLRDWTVNIMHRPSGSHSFAEMENILGRKMINFYVCEHWEGLSLEEQRSSVVHELVHAHINLIRDRLGAYERALGQMIYSPLHESLTEAIEYAVDGISESIAKHYPLPKQMVTHVSARVVRGKITKTTPIIEDDVVNPNIEGGDV